MCSLINKMIFSGLLLLSSLGLAADFGMEIGFRQQSGDTALTNFTSSSQNGIQGGAVGLFPINENLYFRTGMLYTQRPLVLKPTTTGTVGSDITASINYLDVPATIMYKFEDYGGVFVGLTLANQFDKSCSTSGGTCTIDDIKTPLLPFIFGGTFKFAPQLGATLYFESFGGDVAKDLKNYRALGVNLFFTFE